MPNLNYSIHAGAMNATRLPGLVGQAITVGRQSRFMGNSGTPFARLASAGRYAQALSLQTRGLRAAMGFLGTSGTSPIPCASLQTVGPLILAAAAADDILPQFTNGATDHEIMTIARGLIYLAGFSWQGMGEGVLADLAVLPTSTDGDAPGWSIAQGALPTAPTAEEELDLHVATLDGVSLDGMEGLRASFDLGAQVKHNPGKIYPQFIRGAPAGGMIGGTVEFTLPDRRILRSWGEHFKGGALSSLVLTFRQFAQAAARSATAPVTFTFTGAAEVVDAADGRPSGCSVRITGVSANGTTPFLAWSLP